MKENDKDLWVLIMAFIALIMTMVVMSGCHTVHGIGTDLRGVSQRFVEYDTPKPRYAE